MGLPMYVSPSPSKRQLPSKQPTSPPFTPQNEENFEESYRNFRAGVLDVPDISEPSEPEPQRTHRSRRSTSLPYNLVQQHIQRLHQLHHLHRTREQQISSSNLASRRGLSSSQHLSLRAHQTQVAMQAAQAQAAQMAQMRRNFANETIFDTRNLREDRLDDSHDEIIDFSSFDDFVSSLDNNNNNNNNNNNSRSLNLSINLIDGGHQGNNNSNNNNNDNDSSSRHHPSTIALDNVIRRVNLLRHYSQQQENRMRSSSRHHRSSTGHFSSGRSSSSRMTSSQNLHSDRRRDDLIHRGIDLPSSTIRYSNSQLPEPTLLYPNEHNTPSLPPISRLSAWPTRRGVNWSAVPQSQQRPERRSSFTDDFYLNTEVPLSYEDDNHMSRILSPIPRRHNARFITTELFGANDSIDNGSNVDRISSSNEPVRAEQRGSASGEVC